MFYNNIDSLLSVLNFFHVIGLASLLMKEYFIVLVIATCLFNITAMGQDEYKQFYESKIKSFSKMRNGGTALAIIGGVFTTSGIVLMVAIPDSYGPNDFELQQTAGYLCAAVGFEMLVGGIVLRGIGTRKYNEYKERLNQLSFGIKYSPIQKGIMLIYRF